MTGRLSFGVLGPLQVVVDGIELTIPSAKQRALLAALLLARGRVMSVTALVDALWGPAPPATAEHLVQVYVSELRARLRDSGLSERLVTEAPGYRFVLQTGELDIERFEELVSGSDAHALPDALELCRGDILGDVALEGVAAGEAARLEALCLSVRERQLEAQLDGGEGTRVIPDLERLVAAHPYRERLAWLLMLALYRTGRQTDALSVYRATRQRLVDELGVEPGRPLRDLESAILRQDRELDLAAQHDSSVVRRRRRGPLVMAGAVVVAAAAVAIPLLELNAGASSAAVHVGAASVVVLDERSGRPVVARRIGDAPAALATVGSLLAVADPEDRTLELVNPRTLGVVRSVGLPDPARSIGVTGSVVWIGYAYTGRIGWYDVRTGFLSEEFRPAPHAQGLAAIAARPTRIWVSIRDGGLVSLSPTTLRLVSASAAGPFTGLALAGGSLWGIGFFSGDVSRIDLTSGRLRGTTPLDGEAQAIAAGARGLWVTTSSPARVYRLDPRTGQALWFVPLGADPEGIVVGSDAVWVTSGQMLLRIDPSTRELSSTINVGRTITGLASSGNGQLFIATG